MFTFDYSGDTIFILCYRFCFLRINSQTMKNVLNRLKKIRTTAFVGVDHAESGGQGPCLPPARPRLANQGYYNTEYLSVF